MLYERYEKEVVITELGYHVPRSVEATFEQAVNDDLRVKYWEMNAPNVIALITEDNVPLTAVLAWCLIDNYEFESYEFRWGHIAVDYWDPATGKVNNDKGSLKRAIKKSAIYMRDFFGNHTVSPFNNPRDTVQPANTAIVTTALASQVKVHSSNHPKVAELVALEMVSGGAEKWDYGLFVAVVAMEKGKCLNCGVNDITYETVPCRHKTLCKACAMKQATGGKCKVCNALFGELKKM
ncbi:hypothetical protein HDU80_003660 [Chytriomyces hyalinus]|nr:hypothetical protein HDU80_003660 [Chytriomyces hyalinus]